MRQILIEAREVDSNKWIYFEGGEAFLLNPLLFEGVHLA
jgi:hypothetical protein